MTKEFEGPLVCTTLTTTPHESPGNEPCGGPRCKTCPVLRVTDKFSRHTTGKVFKVKEPSHRAEMNVPKVRTCFRFSQLNEHYSTNEETNIWLHIFCCSTHAPDLYSVVKNGKVSGSQKVPHLKTFQDRKGQGHLHVMWQGIGLSRWHNELEGAFVYNSQGYNSS